MKLDYIHVSKPSYANATYLEGAVSVRVELTEDEANEIIAIADRAARRKRADVLKTVGTLGAPQINAIADKTSPEGDDEIVF